MRRWDRRGSGRRIRLVFAWLPPRVFGGAAWTAYALDRETGRPVAEYRVALGRGGTGKHVQGDEKTPLGTYALGAPRPSSRFGTFIPVAYPTPEQQLQGFTGGDVGIHGPDRRFRWVGRATAWFDWTAGCIALGTDEEVLAVAAWMRGRAATISIR